MCIRDRDYPISLLDQISPSDIEEYLFYLKYYEKDGVVHTNDAVSYTHLPEKILRYDDSAISLSTLYGIRGQMCIRDRYTSLRAYADTFVYQGSSLAFSLFLLLPYSISCINY